MAYYIPAEELDDITYHGSEDIELETCIDQPGTEVQVKKSSQVPQACPPQYGPRNSYFAKMMEWLADWRFLDDADLWYENMENEKCDEVLDTEARGDPKPYHRRIRFEDDGMFREVKEERRVRFDDESQQCHRQHVAVAKPAPKNRCPAFIQKEVKVDIHME